MAEPPTPGIVATVRETSGTEDDYGSTMPSPRVKTFKSAVRRLKLVRTLTAKAEETESRRGRLLMSEDMYETMIKCQKVERDHESMVNQFKLRVTASAQQGDSTWIIKALSRKRIVTQLKYSASVWSHAGRVALLLTTLAEEQDLLAAEPPQALREDLILAFLRKHCGTLIRNVQDHRDVAIELLSMRTICSEMLQSKGSMFLSDDAPLFPCSNRQELVSQLAHLEKAEGSEGPFRSVSKVLADNKYRAEPVSSSFSSSSSSFSSSTSKYRNGSMMMLHPDDERVRAWAGLVLVTIVGQVVLVPHNLSFRSTRTTAAFDWLTDVVYLLDVVVQLHVAFRKVVVLRPLVTTDTPTKSPKNNTNTTRGDEAVVKTVVVWNRWRIFANYARLPLVVDAVSLYPFLRGVFRCWRSKSILGCTTTKNALAVYKIFRLVKGLKLFAAFRSNDASETSEATTSSGEGFFNYSRHANTINLCLVWLLLMCTMHFLACGWHAVTGREHWARRYVEYRKAGEVAHDDISMIWLYVMALYESVMILMGEDVLLRRDEELIFAIVAVVVCSVLLAIVFGQVGLLISTMNEQPQAFNRKMAALHEAMSEAGLPGILQERISAYYTYLWKEHRTIDGRVRIAAFLPELSPNLAKEVRLFWCCDMILNVPFFRLYSFQLIQRLVQAIDVELYMPDDYIVLVGQVGHEMFFIKSGTVDVYRVDEAEIQITKKKSKKKKEAPDHHHLGLETGGGGGVMKGVERRITAAFSGRRSNGSNKGPSGGAAAAAASIQNNKISEEESDDDDDDSGASPPSVTINRAIWIDKSTKLDPVDVEREERAGESPKQQRSSRKSDAPPARDLARQQKDCSSRFTFSGSPAAATSLVSAAPWSKNHKVAPSEQEKESSPSSEKKEEEDKPRKAETTKKKIEREQIVCSLHAGDYFGDIALLTQCRRTATVKARTFVTCSIIKRAEFDAMLEDYPEMRKKSMEILKSRYGAQMRSKKHGSRLHLAFQQAERSRVPRARDDDARLSTRLGVLESRLRYVNTQFHFRIREIVDASIKKLLENDEVNNNDNK
ncbi:hypothetical protein CTAYLR_002507 [Chrysophaeum taylorii]|uniref:Cyclic nucleotide-binding domain-containing protein n=1 Tax=Chrysophaeum taylorii TaxID=2483200 RepID=A0AAD7UF43_9STRA|nr:hypothetical protein CTAYLR_002507 [Chrysophaeum taylorii]